MLKYFFSLIWLFVSFCPASGEDLTLEDLTLLNSPKTINSSTCEIKTDENNSSIMCAPKKDEGNISLIDQPPQTEEETYNYKPQSEAHETVEVIPNSEIEPEVKHAAELQVEAEAELQEDHLKKQKSKKNKKNKQTKLGRKSQFNSTPSANSKNPVVPTTIKTFEYTVQEGDTLNTIIEKHFSENIQAGQKIIVVTQPPNEAKPESKPDTQQMAAPTIEPSPSENPTEKPKTIEYTVRAGDTLSSILRKYFNGNIYGKRSRLEKLLELNKDIKEADTIYLGQKIIIPDPAIIPSDKESDRDSISVSDSKINIMQSPQSSELSIYFTYKFNFISVSDPVNLVTYNFNSDYDLEGGFEYKKQISQKNFLLMSMGFSDHSVPRTVLAPSFILEPTKKSHGLGSIGIRYEFSEDNSLGLIFKYRPYYFLTNIKLEQVPAPSAGIHYENIFYSEYQTLVGFGLAAEAIGAQDYREFKSKNGSILAFNLSYRQKFTTADWISIEFLFQQRQQESTYYKMNDKNAGLKFSYTLNLL